MVIILLSVFRFFIRMGNSWYVHYFFSNIQFNLKSVPVPINVEHGTWEIQLFFFNNLPKTPHVGVYVFFFFRSIPLLINLNKMNYGHVIKYKNVVPLSTRWKILTLSAADKPASSPPDPCCPPSNHPTTRVGVGLISCNRA